MSLADRIAELETEVAQAVAATEDDVERFRVAMLGRKGAVTALFDAFKEMSAEDKKTLGRRMNELKQAAQARWEEMKAGTTRQGAAPVQQGDPTRPV
ncbi:MAG: hypothetical protein KDC02_08330, partial [Flavobacteriales bacterium]|nr:hypothetical protein [Flavobacteriales bacterium]